VKRIERQIYLLLTVISAILVLSCQHASPPAPTSTATPNKPASATPNTPASASGPAGFPPAVMNKPYPGTGVVALINRNEGWIEINHEEIKDLMPAMQMEFNVKDKSLLDRVKVGQRVDFTIVETAEGEYLTDIKPAAKP
jgi:Cu/Ag efflux protein CusF